MYRYFAILMISLFCLAGCRGDTSVDDSAESVEYESKTESCVSSAQASSNPIDRPTESGEWVFALDPSYPSMAVEPFIDGIAKVSLQQYWDIPDFEDYTYNPWGVLYGFIDEEGNYILPLGYDIQGDWSDEGTLWVRRYMDGELWGLINRHGEYVVEPRFESISPSFFEVELSPAMVDGKWGYVNQSAQFVIEPQYMGAREFGDISSDGIYSPQLSEDQAVVYDIYLLGLTAQLANEYTYLWGDNHMILHHPLIIDREGDVVEDEGYIYIRPLFQSIETYVSSMKYRLPTENDDPNDLSEISFADLAVMISGEYVNAERDTDFNWHLTYQYPSMWAILEEVRL